MDFLKEVGFTDTQRTRESARNFVRGFLNLTEEEGVEVELPPALTDLVSECDLVGV